MDRLTDKHCEPCRSGAPTVTDEEFDRFRTQVPLWEAIESDGIRRLSRTFAFRNFAEALAFTNKVGTLAETEGHHPALLTEWGRVKVQWWTHKIGGLHRNDFIMAAKTDALLE